MKSVKYHSSNDIVKKHPAKSTGNGVDKIKLPWDTREVTLGENV